MSKKNGLGNQKDNNFNRTIRETPANGAKFGHLPMLECTKEFSRRLGKIVEGLV